MYWKDELDALYQNNRYGKELWYQLKGYEVEILLRNNLRKVGTVVAIQEEDDDMLLHFKVSSKNTDNTLWLLNKKDIKYVDPYLK